MMGGTGVAAGADAAAPLQNPATTVDIQGTSFVFSTFFLELSQRSVAVDQELLDEIRRGGADLSQTSVNVLPNSTCLFLDLHRDEKKKVGAHKLSVCFAEPESSAFELGSRVLAEGFVGAVGEIGGIDAAGIGHRQCAVGFKLFEQHPFFFVNGCHGRHSSPPIDRNQHYFRGGCERVLGRIIFPGMGIVLPINYSA